MHINVMFCTYFAWLALAYGHAWRVRYSTRRFRVAMWIDVACVSVVVLNDPFVVPITSLVYIVIVLGNGMRYGMQCFSEALIGSLIAAMVTLSVRYLGSMDEVTPGDASAPGELEDLAPLPERDVAEPGPGGAENRSRCADHQLQ